MQAIPSPKLSMRPAETSQPPYSLGCSHDHLNRATGFHPSWFTGSIAYGAETKTLTVTDGLLLRRVFSGFIA
jgi:hypothetical protein